MLDRQRSKKQRDRLAAAVLRARMLLAGTSMLPALALRRQHRKSAVAVGNHRSSDARMLGAEPRSSSGG